MDATLRKAAALSKALLDQSRRLPVTRAIEITIYDGSTPEQVVAMAAEKLIENTTASVALAGAAFMLRREIGIVNAACGINDLLTERAMLDAQEKLLVQAVDPGHDHHFDHADSVEIATAKIAAQKERAADRTNNHGYTESINVQVATEATVASLKERLLTLRRRKVQIADELLTLNMTKRITVPADAEQLLTSYKLI